MFNLLFPSPTGCVDFIPAKIQPAGFASQAQYQKFEGVVYQARQWLQHQQGIRVVSVQSVDCKLKKKMSKDIVALFVYITKIPI